MCGDPSMRDRLVRLLEEGNQDSDVELVDDTSLIRSGLMDSLGLFRLALWIEKETRSKLDLESLDPVKEWDTIQGILNFVAEHRER
jgi:acyl carrier protein